MPAVYELSPLGEQVLIDHGLVRADSPLLHRGRGHGMLFQHELMISDILASLRIGIKARSDLRFVSWQEILDEAPETTQRLKEPFDLPVTVTHTFQGRTHTSYKALQPDALFGIEHNGTSRHHRFFALEADRDSEPVYRSTLDQTSWLRKLLQYLELFRTKAYRSHLDIPNLMLLVVTTDEAHTRHIMAFLSKLTEGKGHPHILFRSMPSQASLEKAPPPTPFILNTAWQRVGYPEFFIDYLHDPSSFEVRGTGGRAGARADEKEEAEASPTDQSSLGGTRINEPSQLVGVS
jgi:hypothetical protein